MQDFSFFIRPGFVGEQHIQQFQYVVITFAAWAAQTEHQDRYQVIILDRFLHLAHQMLFHKPVAGDGVLPLLVWGHGNPNAVDLLDVLVVGLGELCPVLGGNHSAAIVYPALHQRITGFEYILGFYIDNEPNIFPGYRCNRSKPDIIGDCTLCEGGVLAVHAVNLADGMALVGRNGDFANLRLALNVPLRNLLHVTVLVFLQAALHNPSQNHFLRQQPLAGGVILGLAVRCAESL